MIVCLVIKSNLVRCSFLSFLLRLLIPHSLMRSVYSAQKYELFIYEVLKFINILTLVHKIMPFISMNRHANIGLFDGSQKVLYVFLQLILIYIFFICVNIYLSHICHPVNEFDSTISL